LSKKVNMAIKDLTKITKHLFLCNGASCKLLGAEDSTIAIRTAINEQGISEQIHTTKTLCNGRCKDGPIVISQPDGIWFKKISADKVILFVKEFIVENSVPQELVLYEYGASTIQVE
jgi:(2Fe-2S) ferredoxin